LSNLRDLASSFSWKAWRAARIEAAREAASTGESRPPRMKPKALSKEVRELGEVVSMDLRVSPRDLDCVTGDVRDTVDWE
jgi:hypothetical protein